MNLLITQSFLFLKSVLPGSAHGDKPAADADGAGAALKGRPSPLRHALTPAKARHRGTAASRGSRGASAPPESHGPGRSPFAWEAGPSPPAHMRPKPSWRRLGNRTGRGVRGLLPRGWHLLPTVTCWVSPCYFGEKVNATPGGSSKEPRARQMRLKQNVPSIHE